MATVLSRQDTAAWSSKQGINLIRPACNAFSGPIFCESARQVLLLQEMIFVVEAVVIPIENASLSKPRLKAPKAELRTGVF